MSSVHSVTAVIKRYFISGVLVVVPLILTYIVLRFLFAAIDGILQPIIFRVFGYFVPGLGVFTTVLIIILAGVLTRNFIGARLYAMGDRILHRMPIIRPIYSAAKQLLESMAMPDRSSFKAVVLIEYPLRGLWALAFLSNKMEVETDEQGRRLASVFVPSTPTPISGWVILVPEDEAVVVDMTVEEGIKFMVSGGVASPALIRRRPVAAAHP